MMVQDCGKKLGSFEGCQKITRFRTGPLLLPERSTKKKVNFLTSLEGPEILHVS